MTQVVVADSTISVVTVAQGPPDPQGLQGHTGPQGADGCDYRETQDANPYHFFSQHKDIASPASTSGSILAADDYVIPLVPKTVPTGRLLAHRNFATRPEGTVLFEAAVNAIYEARLRVIHHFSDINSNIPDLTTDARAHRTEVFTDGQDSFNMTAFASDVVLTADSIGGSLLASAVPYTISLVLRAYSVLGENPRTTARF